MENIWIKEYPEGIPATVDVREYSSLRDIFEKSCRKFSDLPAYSNMSVAMSYGELDELSRRFGAYLQHELGLAKGDRVAIMLPNLLQYPVALFGTLRAGLTVVNVNPLYTARELEYQLRDSGATVIVVLENFARTVEEVIGKTPIKTVITTQVGDLFPAAKALLTNFVVKHVKKLVPAWNISGASRFKQVLQAGKRHQISDVPLTHADIAFLQYTGGTTGVPKGAILTHGNMVANLQQVAAWVARDLDEGAETMVLPLPLYHIFALTSNLVFIKIGANNVLITNPRDLPGFVKELRHIPFTGIIGVNTLYNALLNTPGFAQVVGRTLKITFAGGMAVQRVVAERWKQVTGVPIVEGYGLTETSPVVISNALNIKDWTGTIGLPVPSTEVAQLDEEGIEVVLGEVGEISIRGPQVTKGYWNQPDETAKAFTPDGWFRTGDMGHFNDKGYVKITDRKKDMVLVSGFNVYPNEVEDVIMMHPGVTEVGVIGAPDERSGEVVKAVVVKKDPALSAEQIIAHCQQYLTGYKVPKIVEFSTEPLPKSNIGKILRRLLRDGSPG
ncbi:MAG: long-chain-fatty-acid--CoA ligase [Rhodocyclaceae bacterium]|nr:MAG: long-chain-fatty-acid--CoA ligase [Rhodocyclaceae bacterium]